MRLFPTLFAGAALAAVALPVMAQDPLPNSGPYYIMDVTEENIILAAGGTRARQGGEAAVTISVVSAADSVQDGIARLDMDYRFQCSQKTFKTPGASAYGLDGGFMGGIEDEQQWEAVNMTATSAVIMAYACDGTLPEGIEPIDGDINVIAERYREISAGE
ncbi:MAG TPA: hypothetical protein VGR32_07030 [Brevundimonas sp.]|jgi:hypothetical protein|uniref:hypothetical protein n=1 Tax=Brevundimonas sp. TaxID=1871086 RepID=UPI002DEC98EB|nr:hypothetical protein [Brevundimonas sp.]